MLLLHDCGGPWPAGAGWQAGSRLAVEPRPAFRATAPTDVPAALDTLDLRLRSRRGAGGRPETGLVLLAAYEALAAGRASAVRDEGHALLEAYEVDASLSFPVNGPAYLAARDGAGAAAVADRLAQALEARPEAAPPSVGGPPATAPRTSLPRERYLATVRRVLEAIRQGEVYQANLCQRFDVAHAVDPWELFRAAAAATPAPRAAFVEHGARALVSLSPETFLVVDPGGERIVTRPIKGTRRRGPTAAEDRRAREALWGSAKDQAELLMIVDLERNDLSRVCSAGSVRVPRRAELESYATVHHLVAQVEGRLRPGVEPSEIVRATFPGGSISGAPKRRAMDLLAELEPVARDLFTGCLLWFGDDGSLESSILIRSPCCHAGRVTIGAGGGIVADSDPEQEWREANDKARALTRLLGFEPEEAR